MSELLIYVFLRVFSAGMRFLPLSFWLALGRCLGRCYYYGAAKHNRKARLNLKVAFRGLAPSACRRILVGMYERLAQNFIETLYLPYVDESHVKKYITVVGADLVETALRQGRPVILLGCHAGSWELSNVASAMLFASGAQDVKTQRRYAILAQPQRRHRRLDAYLNRLREKMGCRVIRVDSLKTLIQHLSASNILGAVADHGGSDGIPVSFFGKLAMTPTGSVKLAQKFNAQIILAFMRRVNGPYHEMRFKIHALQEGGIAEENLKTNLEAINRVFEEWIASYPEEYLWFYKRWKYSPQKNILILSDAKAGHLRQSQALAAMIGGCGIVAKADTVDVRYRSGAWRHIVAAATFFGGARVARFLLSRAVPGEVYEGILSGGYDMVISTGSSLAPVNLAAAFEHGAKSIAVMKPGFIPVSRFDLVVMPQHDRPRPRKNVLTIIGSLSAFTKESMEEDFRRLSAGYGGLSCLPEEKNPKIGLLIGGDSKNYALPSDMAVFLCGQIERVLDERDAYLLVTTSRRTPPESAAVLEEYFLNDPRCKLLVIASRENPEGAVGAILYLSDIVVASGESISMVSEAVSAGRHVVVFEPHAKTADNKARRFLLALAKEGRIYLVKLNEIYDKLSWIIATRPSPAAYGGVAAIQERIQGLI